MGISSQPTSQHTQPMFQKDTIIVKKQEKQETCCCICIKCNCEGNCEGKCEGNQSYKRMCVKNFSEYATSPYCITEYCAKPLDDNDPCCDIFMTLVFCVPKQAIFFPCLFGSILNGCINDFKKTNKNYFC